MAPNVQASAIIAGVGPALGNALCNVFCGSGFETLGLSRSGAPTNNTLIPPQNGIDVYPPVVSAAKCVREAADTTDFLSLKSAVGNFLSEAPPVGVAIYNAAKFIRAPFEKTTPQDFLNCYETNVLGAVNFAKIIIPVMLANNGGTIIFTGATASLRGGADFSAFASSKFALRGLAQSLARTYQSQGVHIAHVILDGAIAGSEASAPYRKNGTDALQADEIAQVYLDIIRQPKSAWTHELDLRPSTESF